MSNSGLIGADLGMTGRLCNTIGILQKKKQKKCAPPPQKNPGSATV